jgi:hypothetical protein
MPAAVLLGAFVAALVAALLFGTALALPLRLSAAGLVALAAGPEVARLAGAGGRRVLGRTRSGRWWLSRGGRRRDYVQPPGPRLMLGRWLWLRFRGPSATHYVFIDGRRAEPEALRRLQVTLRLDPDGAGGLSDRGRLNC